MDIIKICECGHKWIEHRNRAHFRKGKFVTDTKECHFCKCKKFKAKEEKNG